jgi:hypothetical protein
MNRKVMPGYTKEIVAAVFALVLIAAYFMMQLPFGGQSLFGVLLAALAATFAAGTALLYCYIYGDAKRRNMNAALWTVLAIFAPSGIGIILYFLLREPIAACCNQCGTAVPAGFAFCPHCGAGMVTATCPQCHRIPQPGWSHCASCGAKL